MKTKRNLPGICLMLAVLLLAHSQVKADQYGDFTYSTDGTNAFIVGYTGNGGAVVIPDNINGWPVVSIGPYSFQSVTTMIEVTIGTNVSSIEEFAFSYCSSLINVTIPNSVTNLGKGVFDDCSSLINIAIGNSVTSIGPQAFSDCASLTNVIIPSSVTSIGWAAFESCYNMANVTIPGSVTSIGAWAFLYCGLTSIIIPDGITNMDVGVFAWCANLTNITISDGSTTIGSGAFAGCTSLTSVLIPFSVTNIGTEEFTECTGLRSIFVDILNPAYSSVAGVLFNKNQTILIQFPGSKAGSYTVPDGVTSIEDLSFYDCANLIEVTIPNNVTNIGIGAFDECTGLTRLTIPNKLTSIASAAFANCSSLTNVMVPSSVTNIGSSAFYECTNLASIYFQGNSPYLTEATFPSPGVDQFSGDDNATVYYLPGTMGWDTTFGGLPTVLWLPQIQDDNDSFGMRTNQFGFTINWASGQTVVVDACTNLANPVWQPLQSNTLTSASFYFSDPQWTNYPGRFYRLRSP